MKRCGECGWPNNEDHASNCDKCGAPLSGVEESSSMPEPPQSSAPVSGNDGKKTVIGGGHNIPSWDAQPPANPPTQPAEDAGILKCDSCGFYPLRKQVSPESPCPNCGTTGANQGASPQSANPANLKKTQMFGEISFDEGKPKKFKLIEGDQTAHEFEGSSVSIGRESIDPQNFSISGQHATIEMVDGQWHISNDSSNGFTFVQVKGKAVLNDGDIIVVGNKIFQFRSEG